MPQSYRICHIALLLAAALGTRASLFCRTNFHHKLHHITVAKQEGKNSNDFQRRSSRSPTNAHSYCRKGYLYYMVACASTSVPIYEQCRVTLVPTAKFIRASGANVWLILKCARPNFSRIGKVCSRGAFRTSPVLRSAPCTV